MRVPEVICFESQTTQRVNQALFCLFDSVKVMIILSVFFLLPFLLRKRKKDINFRLLLLPSIVFKESQKERKKERK